MPAIAEHARGPEDDDEAGNDFLEGFDAEGFEENLEERRNGAEKDAVELAFHNVRRAEFVKVEGKDVEQAKGNQGEAVEEENFIFVPGGQVGNSLEKEIHKAEGKERCGEGRAKSDEEIAAIGDAHLGILREIGSEEAYMAFDLTEDSSHRFNLRGWCSCACRGPPREAPAQAAPRPKHIRARLAAAIRRGKVAPERFDAER